MSDIEPSVVTELKERAARALRIADVLLHDVQQIPAPSYDTILRSLETINLHLADVRTLTEKLKLKAVKNADT